MTPTSPIPQPLSTRADVLRLQAARDHQVAVKVSEIYRLIAPLNLYPLRLYQEDI